MRWVRAIPETGRLHFRKISREINSVVTKPISNSIFPSLAGATALAEVTWLAGGQLKRHGTAAAVKPRDECHDMQKLRRLCARKR
jgi:hypothetical protein